MGVSFVPSSLKGVAADIGKQAITSKLSASSSSAPSTPSLSTQGSSTGSFRKAAASGATSHATSVARKAGKKYVGAYVTIPRLIVRALQLIFALVAAGVYGHQINSERKGGGGDAGGDDSGDNGNDSGSTGSFSPEWLFAVVVAGLAAATAVLFAASTPLAMFCSRFETRKAWPWDMILSVLWIAVFGTFAAIFLKRTDDMGPYKGAPTGLMKSMVWLDLVSAILWSATGSYGVIRMIASRKAHKMGDKAMGKVFGGGDKEGSKV